MAFIKQPNKTSGITYGDILNRYYQLNNVKGLTGEKLTYARSKNLMKLRSFDREHNQEAHIPITKEYTKYREFLVELERKHLLTDKEGKTEFINGNPVIDIASAAYISAVAKLKEKHKADIEERESDIKAYTDFLNEAVPEKELPVFHLMEKSEVTDLDQDQTEAIFWMIKE